MKRIELSDTEFKNWNEEMARKYDPDDFYGRASFLVRFVETNRIKAIVLHTQARPEDRILEVGIGGGHVLENVNCGQLFGVDLSDFMLAKVKKRLRGMVSLSKGNAQSLPFATASFDKVICSEVLEHLQDPDIALKEIARVLKPGGRALISIPNEPLINTLKSMFQKLGIFNLLLRREDGYKTSAKMDDEWHLHSFDLEILLKLAATVLQPKSVVRLPLFITPIRYMVEFERK